MKLEFTVRTSNSNFCVLNDGDCEVGGKYILDEGIDVYIVSESDIASGMTVNELALGFLVGIASGVPSGLIANKIYDHLMDKGKNEIIIQEEKITIITKDELIQYIERKYESQ